jgi:hypothetical protein
MHAYLLFVCIMDTRDKIFNRYEHQLDAFAALDRAYYSNKAPSADDRAAYFARQEEIKVIRARIYQELGADETKNPPLRVITSSESYSIALPDESTHQLCQIKHDALNKLSVVLGRIQLLTETAGNDPNANQHTSSILQALEEMTKCLRQPCPRATQITRLNKSAANR